MTRIFRFLAGGLLLGALACPAWAQPKSLSACPGTFAALTETTENFACTCDMDGTRSGQVWGADIYTADSSICRAALHAGVIPPGGGPVTVIPEPGQNSYRGGARNGIVSSSYGAYGASFRFASADRAGAAPMPAEPASTITVPACPDSFLPYAKATEALTCTCDADAIGQGQVWGVDIYTGDSAICRAALHAGVLPPGGGAVAVIPEPGRKLYPGVTRNGVSSSNWGQFGSSFRFAGQAR